MLSQKNIQGSEFPMPRELTSHVGVRDISVVQDAKKFVKPSSSPMPPPPKSVPPPPLPPKFDSTPKVHVDNHGTHRSKPETVPGNLYISFWLIFLSAYSHPFMIPPALYSVFHHICFYYCFLLNAFLFL